MLTFPRIGYLSGGLAALVGILQLARGEPGGVLLVALGLLVSCSALVASRAAKRS
jgi:hypothetical protein